MRRDSNHATKKKLAKVVPYLRQVDEEEPDPKLAILARLALGYISEPWDMIRDDLPSGLIDDLLVALHVLLEICVTAKNWGNIPAEVRQSIPTLPDKDLEAFEQWHDELRSALPGLAGLLSQSVCFSEYVSSSDQGLRRCGRSWPSVYGHPHSSSGT